VQFEFNPADSAANLGKHGIDFGDTRDLWLDIMPVEMPARATSERIDSSNSPHLSRRT